MERGGFEAQLLDAVGEAVIATDLNARIIFWNCGAERLFGWTSDEVRDRPIMDITPPADQSGDAGEIIDLIKQGETWTGEFPVLRRDGAELMVHVTDSPLRDESGTIIGVIGIFSDTTTAHQASRAHRESERINRAMLEALPDIVFRLSESGEYLDVRTKDTSALAAAPGVLLGSTIADVLPENLTAKYLDAISHALESGEVQTVEYPLVVPSGEERFFEARLAPYTAGEVIAIVRDVTDRQRAEFALRESRNRLEMAMKAARMGTWDLDAENGTILWSQGMHELMDVPPEEFDNRFDTFLSYVHPDDRHQLAGADEPESNFTREFRVIRRDGETRWLQTRGHTYRDSRGRATRMVGVSIDVTERKLHEQALIAAKESAEDMARLKDSFLANMSHEIRTPLTSIIGFADLLIEETSAELQEMARLVRGAGERLMITLESVLDLARLESGTVMMRPIEFDIVTHVREMLPLFRSEAEVRGLYVNVVADVPRRMVRMDNGAFVRVMTNILSNALKFTQVGGITIEIATEEADRVQIAVTDTGIGIDDRFQTRLFDDFAQESQGLSRSYEGVGLGLAITRRLVDLMGGTIKVHSQKGEGTTFTLTFPVEFTPSESAVSDQA